MTMVLDTRDLTRFASTLGEAAGAVGAKGAAALRKTAFDIERDAKNAAPVDTGFLKGSISTSFTGDGRFADMTAEVGPTAEYGIYQELGTSRMAAQPYLAPAFDRRIPEFEQAMSLLGLAVIP